MALVLLKSVGHQVVKTGYQLVNTRTLCSPNRRKGFVLKNPAGRIYQSRKWGIDTRKPAANLDLAISTCERLDRLVKASRSHDPNAFTFSIRARGANQYQDR
jgi:hypothetical protein